MPPPPMKVDLNETEAAALIQLKILEEINNNFEPKFPVNENVWDFASERLETKTIERNGRVILVRKPQTKFFSVRRYPICCQTKETKEAIKNSGPKIQEEPIVPVMTKEQQRENCEAEKAKAAVKKARHIRGQRPYYPFGETPYQEAYQSHIMEYELRDVEEFNPRPKGLAVDLKAGFKHTPTKVWRTEGQEPEAVIELPEDPPNPNDSHPLPRIPAGWKPDNISAEEKLLRLIELAKQTPGFPDPNIKEYYHTQQEIETMRVREEHQRIQDEIAANDAEITRISGKLKDQVTFQQWTQWQKMLNINPNTGRPTTPAITNAIGNTAVMTGALPVVSGQGQDLQGVRSQVGAGPQGGRTRPSHPSTVPPSANGNELTAEQLQQYLLDLDESDGEFSVEEEQDSEMEDIEQLSDAPSDASADVLAAADIMGAENVAKEARNAISSQLILEAEINAEMLQEQADLALQNEAENAPRLQEVADRAFKHVEGLKEEQRRGVPRERWSQIPQREDEPLLCEHGDEDVDRDKDEDMADGDNLYGD
ncbi:hypothetical protein ONS95_013707 [Cadophora gregata]|uniref:uncharacterized protein n=1 Tax=Cadophora gregata TaxID=51156 RepID=UPI0026DDA58F|nr:uncharacterized protein ONS95_013707 [Cadophora gregata]KAK0114207.1 hypothetical protein ONS95_013707 [Cadophora gregata]